MSILKIDSESDRLIMAIQYLRTSMIAKELGVHVNTIRLYETSGFLPPIPRGENGYRQYTPMHFEQARLAHLTIRWPYVGDKTRLIESTLFQSTHPLLPTHLQLAIPAFFLYNPILSPNLTE